MGRLSFASAILWPFWTHLEQVWRHFGVNSDQLRANDRTCTKHIGKIHFWKSLKRSWAILGPEATPEASGPEADLVQAGGLSPYRGPRPRHQSDPAGVTQ